MANQPPTDSTGEGAYRRIDAAMRDKLGTISSATMATLMFRRGLRKQFIQGVSRLTRHSRTMVGHAFTLRHIAAREDIDVVPLGSSMNWYPKRWPWSTSKCASPPWCAAGVR